MAKNFNLSKCGDGCLQTIKMASWFPYRTGWLKFHATNGLLLNETTYRIQFSDEIARKHPDNKRGASSDYTYIDVLENGSSPHNIAGAFGRPLPFGVGGRFNGKFHPGSMKHKGFISNKSVNACIQYICDNYNGELR